MAAVQEQKKIIETERLKRTAKISKTMADALTEEMENHVEMDKYNAIERSRQISKIV